MNNNLEWHVITSSKGGIGKTLLTLILLGYYLENKQDGSVLVLDLNGMNTDSSSILLYRKNVGSLVTKHLKIDMDSHLGGNQMNFQKTYSITEKGQRHYIAGYPVNPFVLYNPTLFADLLVNIKKLIPSFQEEFGLSAPLKYIFIDTNYHFCNLFWQDSKYYKAYEEGELYKENISVWFLWVYRQLEKLVADNINNEATIIRQTAQMMERYLGQSKQDGCSTPFKHVFSPVALITARSSPRNNTLSQMWETMFSSQQRDFIIPEFKDLETKDKGQSICFEDWVDQLRAAYTKLAVHIEEERALLFLSALTNAITQINPNQRPENIMPMSAYIAALHQYTDKDRGDIVSIVKKMKVYKHFSKLLS